jgi:hypothetical protein
VNLVRIGILLVVVAALGFYIFQVDRPAQQAEEEKTKLVQVDESAITGLDLAFPDREISLRKADGAWRMTKPVDATADENTVKTMLSTLTGAKTTRTLDDVTDLAPFGLDKGDPTVTILTASGPQPAIVLGKNVATSPGKGYVKVGDAGKVAITAATVRSGLNKQPKDLRDKQILSFQDDQVQRVDIVSAGGPPVALVKKGPDAWVIEPGDLPADPTEARSYLSSLRSTRAVDFPPDAPPDVTGLSSPGLSVTLSLGPDGAQKQTLLLGNAMAPAAVPPQGQAQQKQIYAQRADQPTIYAVGDWAPRTLSKDANALRDKLVLGFSPDRIGSIVLERREGPGATLVHQADNSWKADGAGDQPTKEGVVTRLVDDLRDLRGSSIAAEPPPADLKPFGLDAPDLRITITDKDGNALGTVLASKHADKFFAMREGGPTVFEVRDYMFTRLDKKAPDFIGPNTPPPPPAPGGGPTGLPMGVPNDD